MIRDADRPEPPFEPLVRPVDLTSDNFYCVDCKRYIRVPKGQGLVECPTPGCTRPTGFGPYSKTPRPARPGDCRR